MKDASAPSHLGIELKQESVTDAPRRLSRDTRAATPSLSTRDYLIERDGKQYAGVHLIVDMWDAERIDELDHVEATLRRCIDAAEATLLHIHLHRFSDNNGVSGVAVLAESHISLHTWPELGYVAFDIFLCGSTNPNAAIEILREAFAPRRISVGEHLRGGPL